MWYRVFSRSDAVPEGAASPVEVERFGADEPGIRNELNSWAAYLETCEHSPHAVGLMERVIQSRQLFTLRGPGARVECERLAAATDGVYQIDGEGFFAVDGTLLVAE